MDTRKHNGGYRLNKSPERLGLTPFKILLAIVCVGILLAVGIGQERTTSNRRTPTTSRTPVPSPIRTSPQRITGVDTIPKFRDVPPVKIFWYYGNFA